MSSELYIGLISGTSQDGLDAALVDLEDGRPDILHASCTPYPESLRAALDTLLESGARPEPEAAKVLGRELGQFFAGACRQMMTESGLKPRDIKGIGSHGQTVWHEPGGADPLSLQLGSGAVIARVTGVPTITDFRRADIEAGGEGAPLAPLLHRRLFQSSENRRAVLNLGGIANLTLLETDGGVSGFDTGPANCLMDLWVRQHTGQPFDEGGAWAASGTLDEDQLARMLDEPYFDRPAPKSTGLETFNAEWLAARIAGGDCPAEDVQCCLAELTARTIGAAIPTDPTPEPILVCGGGVHNDFMMERLRDIMGKVAIESTAVHDVHPDWVEACLFAWLARERLAGRSQDTTSITGAREPVLLGVIHEP